MLRASEVAPVNELAGAAQRLERLDRHLHEMNEPMTVLLCVLDFEVGDGTVEALTSTMATARDAAQQLRLIVMRLRAEVRNGLDCAR